MTIQNNNFEKSSLFFSFNLSSLQERNIYPLLLIQKDFDKRKIDVLKVYIKAFNNFDPSLNCKFSTYAYTYIVGEMKKVIREDRLTKFLGGAITIYSKL